MEEIGYGISGFEYKTKAVKYMHKRRELLYWQSNSEWWGIDKQTDDFYLKDAAPEAARRSFEMYKDYIGRQERFEESKNEEE